jgi:predicted nucleic acid-binding protein
MKNYVVDASVIIKWVSGDEKESDHEKAISLLNAWCEGDADISAPILWQFEVGNFLGRRLKEEASKKMDILLNLKIKNIEFTEDMFRQCFSWMRDYEVTFYDAAYLATAFAVEGTLVTADQSFVNKMKKSKRICLLKNLVSF